PQTTPNIALGVVPAANGGTGLSSPGVEINFLRSDGKGAWRSAPLTSLDIPASSANYIQNSVDPQPAANFNLAGSGTANIFNAMTQYNIGGVRVLSKPGLNNILAGELAGAQLTNGNSNSFFGAGAGREIRSGSENSFFGISAGRE